jgi:hypothetical protein
MRAGGAFFFPAWCPRSTQQRGQINQPSGSHQHGYGQNHYDLSKGRHSSSAFGLFLPGRKDDEDFQGW